MDSLGLNSSGSLPEAFRSDSMDQVLIAMGTGLSRELPSEIGTAGALSPNDTNMLDQNEDLGQRHLTTTTAADYENKNGGGGGGPVPTAAAAPSSSAIVYVGLTETKEQMSRSTKRGGAGNSYQIKFFLTDVTGTQHHCVTGVDTGDSHYEYSAEPGFPALFCHNKAEVKVWAERIMANSQARAGFHTDVVKDVVPTDGSSPQLPTFVSYREEKEETSDGRHVIKWFLIDSEGHGHLAVTGEEKDTKDGHYHYHTETIFNLAAPLEAGNQDSVRRWLESMVVHPGVAPRTVGGKAPTGIPHDPASGAAAVGAGGGGAVNTRYTPYSTGHHLRATAGGASSGADGGGYYASPGVHHSSGVRGGVKGGRGGRGGHGPGRPPASGGRGRTRGRGRGRGDTLLRQATANLARKGRGTTAWRHDPDKEARDLVATELKKWATEEAQARERAKNAALHYVTASIEEREATMLAQCMPLLTQAASQPGFLPTSRDQKASSFEQQSNLLATLSALRELAHAYSPLAVVAQPGVKDALAGLKKHRHPDISSLTSSIIDQWLRTAVTHANVLANPAYAHDPRRELEETLRDPIAFDGIVMAVTHRDLHHGAGMTTDGGGVEMHTATPNTPATGLGIGFSGAEAQQETAADTAAAAAAATMERRKLENELTGLTAGPTPSGVVDNSINDVNALQQQQQQQEQQQQEMVGDILDPMDLENAPSLALVNAPVPPDAGDGAQILPPFEQQLAAEGLQF